MRLAASIAVLAGDFASQQLAYAHVLDACERQGLSPDLDHVEVVRAPFGPRLAGWFPDEVAKEVEAAADGADTLIVVLPGALLGREMAATARLRALGRFDGTVVRA
ncbi:hypothetical protein JQC91_06765 [Jannaschia sp. Os4]|uniref:hypothetical protein n=1 Tax=Jannaschia sp. Os4 TaxID=2807617 RepID=UPI0019395556|nr:hypothetical protein [Jannaschia sp. Os4]MBM2576001.1 hypothetical protein [Jannaschia sp. Os4]